MKNNKLPEGWESCKIGDICKTTQGIQIPMSEQILYPNDGYKRYLYINDFKEETKLRYVKDNYEDKIVTKNDLVMANTGSPGTVFKGVGGILSNNLFKISFDRRKILRDYLFFFLSSSQFQNMLQQKMKGGIQRHLGHKTINDQNILIPSTDIQKKIISILEKTEKALAKRKEVNRLLDEYLKSVFVEMFGDPVNNEKRWNKIKVKDAIGKIENGWSPKAQNETATDGWGILKLSAVTGGSYNQHKNKAFLEGVEPKEDLEVKVGDLLFTRKNTRELVGDSAYVFETNSKLMLPDTIFRFVTKDNVNKIFLWALFNNSSFKPQITALANGSAGSMPNISKTKLMELEIICPSIDEQNKFANVIDKINKVRNTNSESQLQIETLFNSLMKDAFSGKLDL